MLRGAEGGLLVSGWAHLAIVVDPDLATTMPSQHLLVAAEEAQNELSWWGLGLPTGLAKTGQINASQGQSARRRAQLSSATIQGHGSDNSSTVMPHQRVPWDLQMLYHTLGRNDPLPQLPTILTSPWRRGTRSTPQQATVAAAAAESELLPWFDLVCAQPLNHHSRTGQLGFHDVVALRTEGHVRLDRFWNYDHIATSLYGRSDKITARRAGSQDDLRVAPSSPRIASDLVPVTSCFGGLAIYRM